MKRGHTALEYKSKIRRLRKVRPDISISSDFIIGFPGENEQDFTDTMALINEVIFDKSFSFIYSARPGTPASTYTDDVTLQIKKERLALVQKTIDKSTEQISKAMIGSVQKVLVENKAKKGDNLFGRTENMRNTHFKGDESLIGQIVNVKITDARANSLMGVLAI
jgi:tRNA-2-methylthio-N6-dimethylallyladenosine synthase